MIAILNSLPVKEGAADEIVDRFAESRGHVQGFPGFVSMEVLKSDAEDGSIDVLEHVDPMQERSERVGRDLGVATGEFLCLVLDRHVLAPT